MKKVIILFIGLIFLSALTGCSKKSKEPFFNLGYNGRTYMTLLTDYNENGTHSSRTGELGTNYLKVKQNSKFDYTSSKEVKKCSLLIQKADTKEKVEDVIFDAGNVYTNIPQGKYIFTFHIEWENGNASFIIFIEIE